MKKWLLKAALWLASKVVEDVFKSDKVVDAKDVKAAVAALRGLI